MAYDEHTVSHTHNIGVFTQCPKQFTMSSLVDNASMSHSLSSFLASFSRPIRGVSGSLGLVIPVFFQQIILLLYVTENNQI